jgi:mRNA interferase MazF
MTGYKRGDVVLVRFPFTSGGGGKQRPAVVVSSDAYNATSPDVLVISVTSQLGAPPHPGDHVIRNWQGAGLLRESLAQAKIATLEQTMIVRRLGMLQPDDMEAVEHGLRTALDLT